MTSPSEPLGSAGALRPRPLTAQDVPHLRAWYADPDTRAWMHDDLDSLMALARRPDRLVYIFEHVGEPFALLDVAVEEDGRAAVALVVAPAHRRRGVGTAVLRALPDLPELAAVTAWIAEAEQGHPASHALLAAAGFKPTGPASSPEYRATRSRLAAAGRNRGAAGFWSSIGRAREAVRAV